MKYCPVCGSRRLEFRAVGCSSDWLTPQQMGGRYAKGRDVLEVCMFCSYAERINNLS